MTSRSRSRRYPIGYRQTEVGHVMDRWRGVESCSLVGVGSVGKSNIMQHLADPDVQAAYMKEVDVKLFKAIIIDPSMLSPLPAGTPENEQVRCWAGYELLMHRVFMAFYRTGLLDPDEERRFAQYYKLLQDGSNPLYALMGLRYFELGLEIFMQRGIQLVFMFDEFEEMLRLMPVKFFLTLRGLRDLNKRYLSYLTFTRSPLPDIIRRLEIDPLDIEQFIELFTDNVYYVGPFNEEDAQAMVDELKRRNKKEYDGYAISFLLWATGRFAGLLRAGFRSLEYMTSDLSSTTIMGHSEELAKNLAKKQPVQAECSTIWTSLSEAEQYILRAVVGKVSFHHNEEIERAVNLLVHKKLLQRDARSATGLSVQPPVFRFFVEDSESI